MNICRITSAFPPPWNGLAPGPYALSLAQYARGAGVTVMARESASAVDVDSKAPFPVQRVPASYDIQFSLRAFRGFKAIESRGRRPFDIVHGHGFSAFGFLAARKTGVVSVPVVTTFHCVRRAQRRFAREALKMHGNGSEEKKIVPSRLRLACEAFQERLVAMGSDGLIAVSEEIRRNLIEEYGIPPEKVFMAGNGVDAALFSPAQRPLLDTGSGLNLLWVGRFTGQKGEMDLISACGMLKERGVGFSLKMVGDGSEREKARRYIKDSNLDGHIEVITYIPNYSMAEMYRQAHVFVFPSMREGMPKVVLEAMACGCPVVATDIPGCRELVLEGRNGFLVPVGSPARIRDAIKRLHEDNGLLNEMGAMSRRIIEKDYTWDAVALRIEGFYQEVLRSGARRKEGPLH